MGRPGSREEQSMQGMFVGEEPSGGMRITGTQGWMIREMNGMKSAQALNSSPRVRGVRGKVEEGSVLG